MPAKVSQERRDKDALAIDCKWLEKCVNGRTKSKILCLKCNHQWLARPGHVQRGHGCPNCSHPNKKSLQKERDEQAKLVNCRWLEPCKTNQTKAKIQCLNCKREWSVVPASVQQGRGCFKCSKEKVGQGLRSSQKQRDKEAADVNCKWLEPYTTSKTKTKIQCLNCRHCWFVKPNSIQQGGGCPNCSPSGFDKNLPSLLYLLINNQGSAKIGITRLNSNRISKHIARGWKLNKFWHFDSGQDAYNLEQKVIKWWRKELNLPPACEKIDGWTETVDTKFISLDEINNFVERQI